MVASRGLRGSWFRRVGAVAVVALTVATTAPGVASAAISRIYFGQTPQNGQIYADTISRQGRTRLNFIFIDPLILTCEDSSTFVWGFWFGDGRGTPLGSDNKIELEVRDVVSVARFEGRFSPRQARGVVDLTLAGLTADDASMLCTSGEVAWGAPQVRAHHGPPRRRSHLDGITRVTVTDDGVLRMRSRLL